MKGPLPLLCPGRCEILKASIHGVVLGTAAVCALYNFAAWTVRRQRHLAVNTGLYTALAIGNGSTCGITSSAMPASEPQTREQSPAA